MVTKRPWTILIQHIVQSNIIIDISSVVVVVGGGLCGGHSGLKLYVTTMVIKRSCTPIAQIIGFSEIRYI